MTLRPIHLALSIALLSYSGAGATRLLASLYALDLGAKPGEVGLIIALYFLFPMLLSWPVGLWADRYGSRGLLLFGLATGFIGLLLPFFFATIWALYAASAMAGIAFAFCAVLVKNLVGLLSTAEDRTRNFSNISLLASLSNAIGPMTIGLLIDHVGHAAASLATALMFALGVAMVLLSGRSLPGATRKHDEHKQGSVRDLMGNRMLVTMLLVSSSVQLGHELFTFYMPIYGHGIGLSASVIGTILASYASALTVIRVVLPALVRRIGENGVILLAFAMATIAFCLVPLITQGSLLIALAFLFGLGFGCGMPVSMMLIFASAPPGRSGETVGVRETVLCGVRSATPVVFGVIASIAGVAAVFLSSALLMAASGAAMYRIGRRRH